MNFASLCSEEQETVINRVRSEANELFIYSSDMRVVRRIYKLIPECIEKTYTDKKGNVTALRIKVLIKDFKKGLFLPTFRGSEINLEGDKEDGNLL